MRRPSAPFVLVAVVAAFLLPPGASAQGAGWEELTRQATQLRRQGYWEEAEKAYLEALEEAERLPKGDERLAKALYNLVSLYSAQQRYTEAEPFAERYLGFQQSALPADDAIVLKARVGLALIHARQRKFSRADLLAQQTLDTLAASTDWKASFPLPGVISLVRLYRDLGRNEEAERLFEGVVRAWEQHKSNSPMTERMARLVAAGNLVSLADAFLEAGMPAQSEQLYLQAIASYDVLLQEYPEVANSCSQALELLAGLYRRQGRREEAESLFARSRELRTAFFSYRKPTL